MPQRRARTRSNPPQPVSVTRHFARGAGHLVSRDVESIAYQHVEEPGELPRKHDFEHSGVELWALHDGSILIRHPKYRLWDDYPVI